MTELRATIERALRAVILGSIACLTTPAYGTGQTLQLCARVEAFGDSVGVGCPAPEGLGSGFVDEDPLAGSGFVPPRRRVGVLPDVPRSEVRFPAWDRLVIEVKVDATGRTALARIARPSDFFHDFDSRAVKAIREWRWDPATRHGLAVDADFFIEVRIDALGVGALGATFSRLRRLPLDDTGAVVPLVAKPWLREIKAELGDVVVAALSGVARTPEAPENARQRVVRALATRGVTVGSEPGEQEAGWGHVLDVKAAWAARRDDLLAVIVRLSIPCGSDAALHLFRHGGSTWTRVLVEEARDYEDISGALGNLKFAVTPPAADGSFHVLVADIPPWCSSVWHPLRYRVRQVVPGTAKPIDRLVDATEPIAQDAGYELDANADGFVLTFSAGDDDNPGMRVRERIRLRALDGQVSQARSRVATKASK